MPTETPRRPMPQAIISPQPGSIELRRRPISTHNIQTGATGSALVTPSIKPINQPQNASIPPNTRIINPASIGFRK